jgi:hypothetical protein
VTGNSAKFIRLIWKQDMEDCTRLAGSLHVIIVHVVSDEPCPARNYVIRMNALNSCRIAETFPF